VGAALSDRALVAVEEYVKVLGVELHGDAFVFRNRSGAPYSSDTPGDDFRRHAEFGPTENRTLADFRRSGAQEAFAGDAKPADVSHAMADTRDPLLIPFRERRFACILSDSALSHRFPRGPH
jgi:hypothetical protein